VPKTAEPQSIQPRTSLPRVRWHQWSVVRLAAIAMVTVVVGYLTAAVLAVKSIDQLLHIVHDDSVEKAILTGMDAVKEVHKSRQEHLIQLLQYKIGAPTSLDLSKLRVILTDVNASQVMRDREWRITTSNNVNYKPIQWINKQDLGIGNHIVHFPGSAESDTFHQSEEVLQRYKVIGFELRQRIRPALITALSITLAIMCTLLMLAFTYMALRSKTRIQKLVQGFIQYAEKDDAFRFKLHWHNELGLLSRQFNRMADELDTNRSRAMGLEKLASWQTIARKMAHEIKNPLTPIQIMIGQLKRNYNGHDQEYIQLLEKAHNVILEEVTSLRRMVDDFSQFAQLPSPRFSMHDAMHCARQVVALAEETYTPHPVIYEGPKHEIIAEFDDQLMRHALHNLIKNAAEADLEASYPIILRLKEDENFLLYEVEDHGPGIPSELKMSIFEAYVTTKHTGPNPGMGLGLAICQKIVLEHGGKIGLESTPGRTIFSIWIPRVNKGALP